MKSGKIAQTIILSSLVTSLIIGGGLYLLRDSLISYFRAEVVEPQAELSQAQPLSTEEKIVQSIQMVNPSVVSVVVTKDVPVYEQYYETFEPWGLFGSFKVPRVRENGTEEQQVGGGSGFIVSNDGLIVTNRHVVEDTEARYSVLLNDGVTYNVAVLARDPQLDIAVLKISDPLESSLTYATFGDSGALQLGETVIAIGNALGEFRNSVSVGVVSGLSRSIIASDGFGNSEQLDQVIQTDAAINPGNSGGPLLNKSGEVIGVNVAVSQEAENIGFALPAHVVKIVTDSVKKYGEIVRPYIGVRYVMVDGFSFKNSNLGVDYGAMVVGSPSPERVAVLPGSPADRAGVLENDIILAIDGEDLRQQDLASVLRRKEVGQEIVLKILREEEEISVSLKLDKAL